MEPPQESISDGPVRAALGLIADGLAALSGRPLALLGDRDLLAVNRHLVGVVAQVQGARLAQLAEIDDRGPALAVGASSTLVWLKTATLARHGAAVAELRLARALDDRYPDTATALAAGQTTVEHAEQVRDCIDSLPSHVDAATRHDAERHLLDESRRHDPRALHRLGQHLHTVLDPDGPAEVEQAERSAFDARELWAQACDDGTVRVRGRLDPETGALFLATLEPLADRQSGEEPELRTAAQRRADAFADMVRLAAGSDDAPTTGGATPTVVLTMDYTDLVDQTSGGTLDTGVAVTPAAARRLACDASLIAAVLGTTSEVLDIGRRTRIIPSGMRRALALRDRHCQYPGCARPPARCHAHHVQHWAQGGATALSNLVLLCHYHHRVVHNDGWTVTPNPGAPPSFHPPAWAGRPDPPTRQ